LTELIEDSIIGFLAGLSVAVCGAIKDAPYEGFNFITFMRSPIIGAIEAPIISYGFPSSSKPLIFLSTIATERLTIELYKLIRTSTGSYIPAKFTEIGEWGKPHWSKESTK